MVGFVIVLVVVVCLVGGLFYGWSYLRAKSSGTSVTSEIVKSVDELTKK